MRSPGFTHFLLRDQLTFLRSVRILNPFHLLLHQIHTRQNTDPHFSRTLFGHQGHYFASRILFVAVPDSVSNLKKYVPDATLRPLSSQPFQTTS